MIAPRKLGAYVHWPYCARICPYCDFNVYKNRAIDAARWTAALVGDLRRWREETGARRLESLYFGGGTPSLAPLAVVEGVIAACDSLWGFSPDAEITLEANPTDAEEKRFAALKAAGVNRLSLGVQAFEDDALRFLKRNHTGDEARRALISALDAFENVSFDLIYALPGETPSQWRRRLGAALSFGAPHLSLYTLTIEEDTAFANAARRGLFRPLGDDASADLFDIAQEATAEAGLPAYEISNHAREGRFSRHNLLYWLQHDYVGVGPGAHGRLGAAAGRKAVETLLDPQGYLLAVETAGGGVARVEMLGADAVLSEKLAMGLRLVEGVDLDPDDYAAFDPDGARIFALAQQGLVLREGPRLVATADGRRLLNSVLAALLC